MRVRRLLGFEFSFSRRFLGKQSGYSSPSDFLGKGTSCEVGRAVHAENAIQGGPRRRGAGVPTRCNTSIGEFILPDRGPKTQHASVRLRNLRDMATIAAALDHLACRRAANAADVLAQRLIALEMSSVDRIWDRAQHVELVEQDSAQLADRELHLLANREMKARKEQESLTPRTASYSSRGDSSWSGKGSWSRREEIEKSKGYKAKGGGKDKGKHKRARMERGARPLQWLRARENEGIV